MRIETIGLILFIVILSIIDIFANVFSFIPILGDILETLSETIIEIIQIIAVIAIALIESKS